MLDHREQAQSLRQRLNDQTSDIELLAMEARTVFEVVQSQVHVRWLMLELEGYGVVGDRSPLHAILGIPEGARLAVHVLAYRVQEGRIVERAELMGWPFRHFFVEPIRELLATAQRVRPSSLGGVRLNFGPPNVPDYPVAGLFPADVFDRVLLGFRAVLHLQLGSIGV